MGFVPLVGFAPLVDLSFVRQAKPFRGDSPKLIFIFVVVYSQEEVVHYPLLPIGSQCLTPIIV